jgi:hypothetical protein
MSPFPSASRRPRARAAARACAPAGAELATGALALACAAAIALACAAAIAQTAAAAQTAPLIGGKPIAVATLEQCATSAEAPERSVTFAGEMNAIPGSVHMQMRIDVLERQPAQGSFHMVTAPGLGVWRSAAAGVKQYRYLKQVSNLAAPAFYRGAVRFRWLSSKGRPIRTLTLLTPRCEQPQPAGGSGESGSAPSGTAVPSGTAPASA